jgi:DNA-binding beta-propeller fold protein YncE
MRRTLRLLPLAGLAALAAGVAGCGGGPADGPPRLVSRSVAAPSPAVSAPARVDTNPTAVAVGEGSVWVANNGSDTVSRLDADTGRSVGVPIRVASGPRAVSVGERAVWVIAGAGEVFRIDPDAARARRVARVDDATGVVAGLGSVWVTSRAGNRVVRLDPGTGRTKGRAIRVGRSPTDIAIAGGAVWVANSAAGTLSRLDPSSRRLDRTVRVGRRQVLGLAGAGDRLWAAKTDSPLASPIALVGVDARTGHLDGSALRVPGGVPVRLAAGAGGVWLTDLGSSLPSAPGRAPAVTRVDPQAPAIAGSPIRVGQAPAGIAVGAGSVWVTNSGDGTVSRIRPRPVS